MKKETTLGIFIAVILLVAGYFIFKTESFIELVSRGKRYPVYARFASVSGMYSRASVRLAGVKIGIVESIYLEDKQAVVKMLISNRQKIYNDSRAIISTFGFVGEKFVEIVYKDEFKAENPAIIPPNGEIKTLEPFSLDEVKTKFDIIYEKIVRIADSIHGIVADAESKESLRAALANFKSVAQDLKTLLAENGKVGQMLDSVHVSSLQMQDTIKSLDRFIAKADKGLNDKEAGVIPDLQSASAQIEEVARDAKAILDQIKEGKGSAGKLVKEEDLYNRLNNASKKVNELLDKIESKTGEISQWKMQYEMSFDYFPYAKSMRSHFNLNLYTPKFVALSGITEDRESGKPYFTVMAGNRWGNLSWAAGMFESDLGASVQFALLKEQLNLGVYASKFFGDENPLVKTLVSFTLTKNIRIMAGYQDLLERRKRDFFLGIGFISR